MFLARSVIRSLALQLCNGLKTSAVLRSDDLMIHRDTSDNNPSIKFEFTPENMERVKALIANYPRGFERSALGAALDLAQRQNGWLSISAMHCVAAILNIPKMRVYEFATFYTMYRRRNMGTYFVQVCGTTPCMLCGAEAVQAAAEKAAGAVAGGPLSSDAMFGVAVVECQGACVNAPVVVINDDYYEDLTPENIVCIIERLKKGEIPPPGPQSGRFAAEPLAGLTSLKTPPPGPGFMVQEALGGSGGGGGGGAGCGAGAKK